MIVYLFADGSYNHHNKHGGYGVVAHGAASYSYAEMVVGCNHSSLIEYIATCEAIMDLASRLKHRIKLSDVDLIIGSDNDSVKASFSGKRVLPDAIKVRYPFVMKLLYSFKSFSIVCINGRHVAEADGLSKQGRFACANTKDLTNTKTIISRNYLKPRWVLNKSSGKVHCISPTFAGQTVCGTEVNPAWIISNKPELEVACPMCWAN